MKLQNNTSLATYMVKIEGYMLVCNKFPFDKPKLNYTTALRQLPAPSALGTSNIQYMYILSQCVYMLNTHF